jgi:serine/threonine protein kinase
MEQIPQAGDHLGRFRLERRLGQGATGVVYLARDTLLDTDIALKLLNPFVVQSKAFERLRREVLLARQISHPFICRIFDFHQEQDFSFITMEYIDGPTLETVISKSGTLSTYRVGKLTSSICDALSAAHEQSVIHRSLTPGNIIVRTGDQVSVLDFGLAKSRDMAGSTGAGSPAETIHYMPPEILMAKPATVQSDIYSLGVILYRCITGKLPFQGKNAVEITNAILAGNSVPPRLLNPDVAAPLGEAITKSMALDPRERFQSAAELRQRLLLFMDTGDQDSTDPSLNNIRSLSSGTLDCGLDEETTDPGDSKTQQIRMRDTTILFSDIIGITPYFEKHGDIAGRKRLQKHNEQLFPIIQKHNGTVLKTIGDAIMAYFDHADDGVEAAIEMQDVLEKANRKTTDKDARIFIRIGVHSGHAIIENQDVFGDAVNVASRINSMAESGQIMTSSFTRDKLKRSRQRTKFHSSTTLKGKSEAVKLFTVSWDRTTVEMSAPETQYVDPETRATISIPPGVPIERKAARPAVLKKKPAHPAFLIAVGAILAALAIIGVALIVMLSGPPEEEVSVPKPTTVQPIATPRPADEPEEAQKDAPAKLTGEDRYKSLAVVEEPPADEVEEPEPTPEPEPPKPAAVSSDPNRTRISLKPELNRLKKTILATLRKKGIRIGDSTEFDSQFRKMTKLWKGKKYKAALAAGKLALASLKQLKVDKAFIQAKLLRFNRVFDKAGESPATAKVADLAQDIVSAVESGEYAKANRLLNRSFSILKSTNK